MTGIPVAGEPARAHDQSQWARLCALLHDSPAVATDVALARDIPEAYFAAYEDDLLDRGIESPDEVHPWLALIDALATANALAYLDWKASADDLVSAIGSLPHLAGRGIDLDPLRGSGDRLEAVLGHADRLLADQGLRLLHLDEDSDAYPIVVVPERDAAEIVVLAAQLGNDARYQHDSTATSPVDVETSPTPTPSAPQRPAFRAAPFPPFEAHQADPVERWCKVFADGNTFVMAPQTEVVRRKLRGNTVALIVLTAIVAAVIALTVLVAVADIGRWVTYLLLAAFLVLLVLLFFRILKFRRALIAARSSGPEYLAITRDGVRVAGTDVGWHDCCGGLIVDERHGAQSARQPRLAALMRAIGYSRVEVHLGAMEGKAGTLRDRATPGAKGLHHAFLGNGGVRIPLEWAVPDDRIGAVVLGIRVSAALAGVPVVASADPTVVRETLTAIWSGRRPDAPDDTAGPVDSSSGA